MNRLYHTNEGRRPELFPYGTDSEVTYKNVGEEECTYIPQLNHVCA